MSGRTEKKAGKKIKRNRTGPTDEEKYQLAPLSVISRQPEGRRSPEKSSSGPRNFQMHSNISLNSGE